MPKLETLPASSSTEAILEVIRRDGACILADAMEPKLHAAVSKDLDPFILQTKFGKDDFSGTKTQRCGALIARSESCRELVMDKKILELTRTFLRPFSKNIQVNTTQAINIHPGEGEQLFHRDRFAWGKFLPKEIETQLSTIWALSDFTEENGATRLVPGSPSWDWKREAKPEEICQAIMPAGSVLIFTGSVIHSGGKNYSQGQRLGVNITYCLGWLRQEENQYLSCPPEVAKGLSDDLRKLVGYSHGDYALGYYSDPSPLEARGAGIFSPEDLFKGL